VNASEREWNREWEDLQALLFKPNSKLDPLEKTFLREIQKAPREDVHWNVYGDWLEERLRKRAEWTLLERGLEQVGKMPPGRYSGELQPKRGKCLSCWLVQDHVAQMSIHTASEGWRHRMFAFWVIFDDLWAGAHPDLAHSLLRLLDRWDVLSDPRKRNDN
jgi:uncharacterized protein (TIGR02996 family)